MERKAPDGKDHGGQSDVSVKLGSSQMPQKSNNGILQNEKLHGDILPTIARSGK